MTDPVSRESVPHRGFTLIELSIVVTIVLILLLISVPSFLEAKVRSNVSTARIRMEAMKAAMLAHRTDWGSLPADFNDSGALRLAYRVRSATSPVCADTPGVDFSTDGGLTFVASRNLFYPNDMHCPLTTPIQYIEPNRTIDPFSDGTVPFGYDSRSIDGEIVYGVFTSAGPDLSAGEWLPGSGPGGGRLPYSPTNGTSSPGEYWGVVPCEDPSCLDFASAEFSPLEVFPKYDTDIDGNGIVDSADLLILMQDWGKVSAP